MTALKKNKHHIRDSAGRKKHSLFPSAAPAAKSGTVAISGELSVHRLGFGAMQLTGRGVWGEPADRAEAIAVLRRAVELGINLIDTADSYGPYVAEELIREALHPYPAGLVIATKAGLVSTCFSCIVSIRRYRPRINSAC
jgi:predicted oxidoreductase